MKKVIFASQAWDTPSYDRAVAQYLPNSGEGDTLASQCVTAVNKLVYRWYNDGDVFDSTNGLGWANDLSDYANWLYKYVPYSRKVLDEVFDCFNDDQYDKLLRQLVETCLDDEDLEAMNNKPTVGSIYNCDGPYHFSEDEYDEEYEEEEEE